MLNLQFFYISMFYLPFLLFFVTTITLILNYLMYVKNFLFYKLKNNLKFNNNTNNILDYFVINKLLIVISFIIFTQKFSNNLQINYNNFYFNKYVFFILIFLFFLTLFIHYLFKYDYNINYTLNYNGYIPVFFSILIYFIVTTTNFLIFFFFLELLSYLFYFQFLQIFNKIKTKKITNFYLDSLLLYYWINFLGSIIILYSIIYLFYKFNTVNFIQLNYFYNYNYLIFFFFFFLGFSFKMGLPGFHFLKIEIYKNLKLDSIINFSFLSIFGYLIILKFLFLQFAFFINFSFLFIFFFIFLFFFFIPTSLKINNIVLFFGYSTILNTILCLFLIL